MRSLSCLIYFRRRVGVSWFYYELPSEGFADIRAVNLMQQVHAIAPSRTLGHTSLFLTLTKLWY
jgi:hypothetical protein